MLLLVLSVSLLQAVLTLPVGSSSWEPLQPNYILYCNVTVYNGQSIRVELNATAPVTLMIMTKQQYEAFSQGKGSSTIYSIVTSNLRETFSVPGGGEYYVVVDNNVSGETVEIDLQVSTVPILPTTYFSSLPAPVGIGYFGVVNESGTIRGIALYYYEAIGYATIYSILAYNASPPKGIDPYGAGLQMNAVLQVNTTHGTYAYWLQNTVGFNTKWKAYEINDNVWNYTSNMSILSNFSVTGTSGYVSVYNKSYVYLSSATWQNYSLPFSAILYTKLDSVTPNSVNISFGYNLGNGVVWYDNVTIHQTGIISATLVINPFNSTPNGEPYDLDLVFVGAGNGEWTYFEEMNASLALQAVLFNGTTVTLSPVYPFGITGERADNLKTIDVDGRAFVVVGNNTFWKQINVTQLPVLYFNEAQQVTGGTTDLLIGILFLLFLFLLVYGIYRLLRRLIRRHRRRRWPPRGGHPPSHRPPRHYT